MSVYHYLRSSTKARQYLAKHFIHGESLITQPRSFKRHNLVIVSK